MAAVLERPRKKRTTEYFDKYPPEIQAMILKPAGRAESLTNGRCSPRPSRTWKLPDEDAVKQLTRRTRERNTSRCKAELAQFDDIDPGELPGRHRAWRTSAARRRPRTSCAVGVYDAPKEEVQPGFLTLLDPAPAKIVPPARRESTGRRTALAKWLTDPENPLPARVMVNRIWHYHFGKGIVGTPSDFGVMGERPTHPELLDWLAKEFVRGGWSMKHMHRLIMTSAVYQAVRRNSGKDAAEARPGESPAVGFSAAAAGRRSDPRFQPAWCPAC